jgi:hypothetical protein
MANKKISELPSLTTPASGDQIAVVDISGTPTTKRVTANNLMTLAPVQSVAGRTGAVTLSDTDISGLGTAATTASTDYATAAQGTLADSATQPGDNISTLTNDSNFIDSSGAPVQSVAGRTGTVTLSNTDVSGLGTAATLDVGTSANNIVQLNGSAQLPAVDGSLLTNLPSGGAGFLSIVTPTFTGTPLGYTLTSSENGKVVVVNESSTAYITVPQSLGSGFNCTIVQQGTGKVVLEAGTGASVAGYDLGVATIGQYGVIDLVPIATDSYYVTGDTDRAPFLNTYSADFDGTNEHLHFGTSATNKNIFFGTGDYAFSIWFRQTATSNNTLYEGATTTSYGYVHNQTLHIRGFTGSNETFSSVVVNNDWNHLVITRVSGTVDIYLNNSSRTGALTIAGTSPVSNPFIANFGFHVISGYFWQGQMDEISFHIGSGLSSSQVSAMYNSGSPIDISSGYGATHWWRMGDSFSGTTIADQIGSEPLEAANGVDLQSTTVPS